MYLWQQYANSEQLKNKIALRDDSQGEVFSWRQLADKINEYVIELQHQGVVSGEGFALCAKNGFVPLCYYLAALQLGCRVLPINPAFVQQKKAQLCVDNNISCCITFSDEQNNTYFTKYPQKPPHFLSQAVTMTLTSGSGGWPKAVVHTIDAHLENARGVCELMQFNSDCSWLLSLPLYHVSGQGIVWRWLLQGAVLHFPGEDLNSSLIQATHASLVPVQLQRLLDYLLHQPSRNITTRHILLGGSDIPISLPLPLPRFGICSYVGYGMTEMASTVFAKLSDGKPGVGRALKGREYCLRDGEIWLRGAGLGLGYWQKGRIIPLLNEESWFQTKDRGIWQDNGLVVSGRLDNMFISGGENIQPEEIEQIIQQYDEVEQVFVLPVEDQQFGQRPVAMIRFKRDFSQIEADNLRIWLSDKVEKFKQPIAYFPLTTRLQQPGTIKISRRILKTELDKILGK